MVLDLSRLAPGSFCTMILGDLGADILKVEEPRQGRLVVSDKERTVAYDALDRNKRSIVLNLKSKPGRKILHHLAQRADVIVEGFRPGVVKRLGVDYDTIKGINPRLVYCSLSGYGQDGPYHNLPGHDVNFLSVGGALAIIGTPDGAPIIPSNLLADFAAGAMNAAIGILAALMARGRTGRGQFVDIGMADGVVSLMAFTLRSYFESGVVPQRGKELLAGGVPFYSVYETKDGKYISIGCIEPPFYENLCRALGREDLIAHQWAGGEKREEIFSAFREIFGTRTRDDWFDYLRQWDICVAKVNELDELATDPQLIHRHMILELDHPKFGKVRQPGISIKLSQNPGSTRSFGPLPGQHTEEVLLQLGYSEEDIEQLRKEGVAG